MPKGSLIFAPILFKKIFGASALDFSQLDYSLLAIKVAASFALWMCYRTYKTTKDLQLHITPLVPVVKNQVEKVPMIKYVKSAMKSSLELAVAFAGVQALTCSFMLSHRVLFTKILGVILVSYFGIFYGLKNYHKEKMAFHEFEKSLKGSNQGTFKPI